MHLIVRRKGWFGWFFFPGKEYWDPTPNPSTGPLSYVQTDATNANIVGELLRLFARS